MAALGRVERTRPRPTGEEGKLSARLRRIDFPPPMQWQDQRDSPRLAGEAAHFRRGDPASSPPASPVSPPLRLLAPSKAASRPRQTRPPDQLTEREGETNRRTGPRRRRRTRHHSAVCTPHHSHGLQRQAITITSLASTEVIPKLEAKFNYNLHMATNW